MTTQLFRTQLLAAVLGAFLFAPAVLSQPAATGPWANVPVFPTAASISAPRESAREPSGDGARSSKICPTAWDHL